MSVSFQMFCFLSSLQAAGYNFAIPGQDQEAIKV